VKTFLSENPQLMAEIDERVRDRLAPKEDETTLGLAEGAVDPDDQPITLDT